MEILKSVSYPNLRLTTSAVRWSLLASEDGPSEEVNVFLRSFAEAASFKPNALRARSSNKEEPR